MASRMSDSAPNVYHSQPHEKAEYTFFKKRLDSGLQQTHLQLNVLSVPAGYSPVTDAKVSDVRYSSRVKDEDTDITFSPYQVRKVEAPARDIEEDKMDTAAVMAAIEESTKNTRQEDTTPVDTPVDDIVHRQNLQKEIYKTMDTILPDVKMSNSTTGSNKSTETPEPSLPRYTDSDESGWGTKRSVEVLREQAEPEESPSDQSGSNKTGDHIPELRQSPHREPDITETRVQKTFVQEDITGATIPSIDNYENGEVHTPEMDEDPTLGGEKKPSRVPDIDYWELVEKSVLGVNQTPVTPVATPSIKEEVPPIVTADYGNEGYKQNPQETSTEKTRIMRKYSRSKSGDAYFRTPPASSPNQRSTDGSNEESYKSKRTHNQVHKVRDIYPSRKSSKSSSRSSKRSISSKGRPKVSGSSKKKSSTKKKKSGAKGSRKLTMSTKTTETSVVEIDKRAGKSQKLRKSKETGKDPTSILKKKKTSRKKNQATKKSMRRARSRLKGLLIIPAGLVERYTRMIMPAKMRLARTAVQDLTALVEVYTASVVQQSASIAKQDDRKGSRKRTDIEHVHNAVKAHKLWDLLAHMMQIPMPTNK